VINFTFKLVENKLEEASFKAQRPFLIHNFTFTHLHIRQTKVLISTSSISGYGINHVA
jgi:hypothetical protein